MLELYWIEPLGLLSAHLFLGGPEQVRNYSLAEWEAQYGKDETLMKLRDVAVANPDKCITYRLLPQGV